jgi:quinol-cytochrome oxidoreductase complex cytochrome b subunit
MHDLQTLQKDFNLHNLLVVIRLFYGYFVIVAILVTIVWLVRYINSHEPTGIKITEMFDERGKKRSPLNLKPVFIAISIIFVLILIYFILLFVNV